MRHKCLEKYSYLMKLVGTSHPRETQGRLQTHQEEFEHTAKINATEHRTRPLMHQFDERKTFESEGAVKSFFSKAAVVQYH